MHCCWSMQATNDSLDDSLHALRSHLGINLILFFLVSYVGERPWWPIQCLNKGRKKKAKGLEEREIRSSLLILDLKDGKL